jgi:hypothetical protein
LIVPDDVRWVVTVPAIWSDRAKQFMRNAAYEVPRFVGMIFWLGLTTVTAMQGCDVIAKCRPMAVRCFALTNRLFDVPDAPAVQVPSHSPVRIVCY